MKKILWCKRGAAWSDVAPLVLRLAAGVVFFAHGWQKWSGDMSQFGGFLGNLGIPGSEFFAWVVTIVEAVGGAALILGIFTHLAAKLLAIDMAFAFFLVHASKGLFISNGGYEFVLVLFAASVSLMITGPGKWSLDAMLSKKESASPTK